ncbi:hypothetical protein Sya03_58120 [Spirilliplanes yamanashiensis]|uniref:Uncharacterized protein n=1 Tax=Spirilliplanes yamanashiensis TaxID=42233 RepID=A0A8J3YEX4_9ACTN|nr:hypothetical protein Sya03_58120 [Spirilliplanes yamanashiensis]
MTAYVLPQTAGVTAVTSRTVDRMRNSFDGKYLDVKRVSPRCLLVKKLDVERMGAWHTTAST